MASQTHGIQQLLVAEKRAAEKVGEARKSKFFLYIFFFHFNQKKRRRGLKIIIIDLMKEKSNSLNYLIFFIREDTSFEAGQGTSSR